MQDKAFANPKISFEWNSEVEHVNDADKGEVTGIVLRNSVTGERKELAVDGVFVAIGHTPNTALFKGQLDTGRQRLHRAPTRARGRACPGVFACGDVQDHIYRQAITAAGSGCMAAHRRRALSRRPAAASGRSAAEHLGRRLGAGDQGWDRRASPTYASAVVVDVRCSRAACSGITLTRTLSPVT